MQLTDMDFADSAILLDETRAALYELTINLETAARKVNVNISVEKTKTVKISSDQVTTRIIVN